MTDRGKDSSDSDDDKPVDQGTSTIEWLAAAIGAILFIVMIGYMTYIGFGAVDGSPKIELTTEAPVRQANVFHVGFVANNSGEATATNLVVRAVLTESDTEVESREVTIDYLPMQSARSGGFFFEHDPAKYKLMVTATAYLDP